MTSKEKLTYALGIIIALGTGFQGYVVKDLHTELTYIRVQRDKQTIIYDKKFSNIEINYMTMKAHDRDLKRVDGNIKDLNNKVYLLIKEK
jgi:hypothetical protein